MAKQRGGSIPEWIVPKEAKFCEEIINRHTESKVRFNCSANVAGSYILYPEEGSPYMVKSSHGQQEKPAVLLKNHYLFQCDISFGPGKNKNTFIFIGISLQFYDNNDLLFRADWDNKDSGIHPQPHWHFGNKQLFQSRVFTGYPSQDFATQASSFSLNNPIASHLDYERLHFAMCMDLQKEATSANYSDRLLKNWLETCLQLFDNQIYLLSK